MVTSVGLSNLAFVDVASTRNQVIIGTTLMIGLMVPQWLQANPDVPNTGITQLDQTIRVLLGTSVFIGGLVAFILDNTVPGTLEERGILRWRQDTLGTSDADSDSDEVAQAYDLPYIGKYIKDKKWAKYVPILQTYSPEVWTNCCKKGS